MRIIPEHRRGLDTAGTYNPIENARTPPNDVYSKSDILLFWVILGLTQTKE